MDGAALRTSRSCRRRGFRLLGGRRAGRGVPGGATGPPCIAAAGTVVAGTAFWPGRTERRGGLLAVVAGAGLGCRVGEERGRAFRAERGAALHCCCWHGCCWRGFSARTDGAVRRTSRSCRRRGRKLPGRAKSGTGRPARSEGAAPSYPRLLALAVGPLQPLLCEGEQLVG